MCNSEKQQLVKDALFWIVSDVEYLHEATGLFAKEVIEARRFSQFLSNRRQQELNKTAHVSSLNYRRAFNKILDAPREFDPETIDAIKVEQRRLEGSTVDELKQEVATLIQKNKDRREEGPIYNRPENRLHRLEVWVRKSAWLPSEAVLILGYREPSEAVVVELENLRAHQIEDSPFATAFHTVKETMQSAIDVGEISSPGRPLEYLRWFDKVKYEVPDELRHAILEIHAPEELARLKNIPDEKEIVLSPSEKNSLLKLVATMGLKGYGFDPDATRSNTAVEIQSDANLIGLSLDQKTILKWLRHAVKLVPEVED